ncbi:hypothetical protein [Pantoea coffeiphila]|uniref:hypothetical protein n=1 Tax=Pantoea coffeiphila TaxID=1465635 RepID=UPI0019611D1D|nr:hypothetical protein [Pantoea coffeiphila]MBM7341361.1 hypothetical protein [Pantoea coffeiphila]
MKLLVACVWQDQSPVNIPYAYAVPNGFIIEVSISYNIQIGMNTLYLCNSVNLVLAGDKRTAREIPENLNDLLANTLSIY